MRKGKYYQQRVPASGGREYGIELSIIDCISLWTYNSRLSVILFGEDSFIQLLFLVLKERSF